MPYCGVCSTTMLSIWQPRSMRGNTMLPKRLHSGYPSPFPMPRTIASLNAQKVLFFAKAHTIAFSSNGLPWTPLYLVCFKDVRETHIRQQFSRHAQDFSGISGSGKNIPRLIGSTSEYYSVALCMGHIAQGWVKTLTLASIGGMPSAKHTFTPQQPPERG